jgi:hypothetical protein
VACNLATAQLFFDRLRPDHERGALQQLVDKGVFADRWTFFSPWLGELAQTAGAGIATVADQALDHARSRLPDFGVDVFDAWPTEDGCAWRWRVSGHDAAGSCYEYWEQVFIETDPAAASPASSSTTTGRASPRSSVRSPSTSPGKRRSDWSRCAFNANPDLCTRAPRPVSSADFGRRRRARDPPRKFVTAPLQATS